MKKAVIWIVVIGLLALGLAGVNKSRYIYHFYGGISVGGGSAKYDANDPNETLDSMRVIDGTLWIFSGGDTVKYGITSAGSLNLAEYAVMLLPDSLHITAVADTLDATFSGADVFVYSADSCRIVIPSGLTSMPIGTTVNFYQMGNAIIRFKMRGTRADIDSLATAKKGDVVGIKKIGANAYKFYGNLWD